MFRTGGFGLAIVLVTGLAAAQEKGAAKDERVIPGWPDPPKGLEEPKRDVSVEAPKDVEVLVEHRDAKDAPWTHVCSTSPKAGRPCGFAAVGGEFRVIGVGVPPSEPFTLRGPGSIKVEVGDAAAKTRGLVVGGVGAGLFVLGVVFFAAASGFADPAAGGLLREEKIGFLLAGGLSMTAGVAGGVYGASMLLDSQRSRVTGPSVGSPEARGAGFVVPLSFRF